MEYFNKINEVVVVEGYHDLAKLREIDKTLDIVITNGSEISEETLIELKKLNEERGLILLLDPDYQGERIRRVINDYVGPTKHAFVKKKDAINKKKTKVGIEHVKKELIIESLSSFYTSSPSNENLVKRKDLYDLDLMGRPNSKQLRKKLCEELGIGLSNGKTLLNKINMFSITIQQIESILRGD